MLRTAQTWSSGGRTTIPDTTRKPLFGTPPPFRSWRREVAPAGPGGGGHERAARLGMGGCLSSQAADDLSLLNDSTGDGASLGPGDPPPPPPSVPPPPYQVPSRRRAGTGSSAGVCAADLPRLSPAVGLDVGGPPQAPCGALLGMLTDGAGSPGREHWGQGGHRRLVWDTARVGTAGLDLWQGQVAGVGAAEVD